MPCREAVQCLAFVCGVESGVHAFKMVNLIIKFAKSDYPHPTQDIFVIYDTNKNCIYRTLELQYSIGVYRVSTREVAAA